MEHWESEIKYFEGKRRRSNEDRAQPVARANGGAAPRRGSSVTIAEKMRLNLITLLLMVACCTACGALAAKIASERFELLAYFVGGAIGSFPSWYLLCFVARFFGRLRATHDTHASPHEEEG